MTLDTIMTHHVVTVGLDDEVCHVQEVFAKYKIHHVVVVERCRVVGVISDRDVAHNVSPFIGKASERSLDTASLHRRAHQIMTRAPLTGAPTMPIGDAALLLLNNNISCLPVVDDNGACVGIVTIRDLLRWALHQMADQTCVQQLATEQAEQKKAA